VYRPVANPVLQPGGDPQRTAHALVVSSNAPNSWGTALVIDVSGDTAAALFTGPAPESEPNTGIGTNPVYATNLNGTDYVVSRDSNSVSAFTVPSPPNSINRPPIISLPQPTSLNPNVTPATPVFAAAAQGNIYVAARGRNSVFVIPSGASSWTQEIPVGSNPVALVAPPAPNDTQLYSLNQGDNTVSVIFPAINQNVATISLPAGAKPVWGTASSDGTRVFIVNQGSNNVSVIDTASDTVLSILPVGASPNYITYQATLNRAYVTSPAGNSLSIIDNNLGTVRTIPMAGAPCNGQHPSSVTALADGTRVYVADDVTSSVCVLNTTSNTFTKRICLVQDPGNPAAPCVGSATPVSIASNSDATRVYTANQYQSASFAIASISRLNTTDKTTGVTTGVVTVTTSAPVPFEAGQPVTIAGVIDATEDFPGVFGITGINLAHTQFTYVQNGLPNFNSTGGTATILPYVSLIQTAGDTLVLVQNSDGSTPPLTIPAGGTPVFIAMTP